MKRFPAFDNLAEARRLQEALREKVILQGDPRGARTLAALDASAKRGEGLYAVAVLWDLERNEPVEATAAHVPEESLFPYVPGYLSFREAPAYLRALDALSQPPELLLVDGQGIAHPRGLGIAAHLGVHLDLPSIGVAKRRLVGEPLEPLPDEADVYTPLCAEDASLGEPRPGCPGLQIGWVWRSKPRTNPLYLSPGHRVGMDPLLTFVRELPRTTKLPAPLQLAHRLAGRARAEGKTGHLPLEW